MKHVLHFSFGLVLSAAALTAQVCSPNPPDPNAAMLGFNPNPIPQAVAGSNYNHQNTVVIPEKVDNTTTPNDPTDSLSLCGIKILSVALDTLTSYNSSIPANLNFTWEVWQGSTQVTAATSANTPINIAAGSGLVRLCLRLQSSNVPAPINAPCDSVSFKVQVLGRLDAGFGCTDVPASLAPPVDFFIKWPICASASIVEFTNPTAFELLQNFPNPANGATRISFNTPKAAPATLEVRDIMGRLVAQQTVQAGFGVNHFDVNTHNWTEGVYLYTVTVESQSISAKMLVNH